MPSLRLRTGPFRLMVILLALSGGCAAPEPRAEAPFDRVVLVTIDTLRADHLPMYGYPRQTAPNLESMAERGVVFERAISPMPHTAPSHASMLTGLLPGQHSLVANGQELSTGFDNAARLLARQGMQTAAFTSVEFLAAVGGDFTTVDAQRRPADRTVNAFLRWLREEGRSDRFFAWIHLYDLHGWRYPLKTDPMHLERMRATRPDDFEEFLERWHGLDPEAGSETLDWGPAAFPGQGVVDFEVEGLSAAADWIDHYDARISFVDEQIGRALSEVETRFGEGRTLWIVTSDHGEGLGSRGRHGHGSNLYEEQLRVPLILFGMTEPVARPAVAEMVGLVDLLPTLAEWFGDRVGHETEGRSFLRQVKGGGAGRPSVIVSQRRPVDVYRTRRLDWQDETVSAVQKGRSKYILHSSGEDELYDLVEDPGERVNLIDADPVKAAEMRRYLERRADDLAQSASPEVTTAKPEILRELQALGYAGAEPGDER